MPRSYVAGNGNVPGLPSVQKSSLGSDWLASPHPRRLLVKGTGSSGHFSLPLSPCFPLPPFSDQEQPNCNFHFLDRNEWQHWVGPLYQANEQFHTFLPSEKPRAPTPEIPENTSQLSQGFLSQGWVLHGGFRLEQGKRRGRPTVCGTEHKLSNEIPNPPGEDP